MINTHKIADSLGYDREKAFAVMCDVLTDCNYHDLRNRLESAFADWLWEQQQEEQQ
jgi:hypothetical protein